MSHLDSVLAEMNDVPGDERSAQSRDQRKGGQNRQRQSSGDDREHADSDASLPDRSSRAY